jgi:hypothetical protein
MATLPVNFPTATIIWIVFIIVGQRFEDVRRRAACVRTHGR